MEFVEGFIVLKRNICVKGDKIRFRSNMNVKGTAKCI